MSIRSNFIRRIEFVLLLAIVPILHISAQGNTLQGNARNVQNDNVVPQITPPSPNTVALEKFGNLPVDYSTGTTPVSLPFMQWSHGTLALSVSLNYHSGGIKIDDMASYAGLGWALSAGGSVNRTVRGIPDDTWGWGFLFSPNLPFAETYAYDPDEYYFPSIFLAGTGGPYGYSQVINTENVPDGDTWVAIENIDNHYLDGEQDLFSYSCGSINGQFVLDKDKQVRALKKTNDKIEVNWDSTALTGFTITDQMGIKYFFTHPELQLPQLYANPLSIHLPPNYAYTSSWYVSLIVDPVTADSIKFEYTENNSNVTSYETSFSESATYVIKQIFHFLEAPSFGSSYTKISGNDVTISRIRFPDSTLVNFSYLQDREDYHLAKRLNEIALENMYGETIKKWKMNFSYFISPPMTTVVPDSSPNNSFKRLKLDSLSEVDPNGATKTTGFQYNNIALNPRGSYNQDIWGYNVSPYRNNVHFIPETPLEPQDHGLTGSDLDYIEGAKRDPDSVYCKAGMLEKIIYPTGGYTQFEYECNRAYNDTSFFENKTSYTGLIWDAAMFNHSKPFPDTGRISTAVRFVIKANELSPRPEPDPNEPQSCFGQQDIATVTFRISSTNTTDPPVELHFVYQDLLGGVVYTDSIPTGGNYVIEMDYDTTQNCLYEFPFEVELGYSYEKQKQDKLVGGLRIKKIKDFDGQQFSSVRSFTYNGDNERSSGKLSVLPYYHYYRTALDDNIVANFCFKQTTSDAPKNILHLSSGPTQSNTFFNGAPLIYERVTEHLADQSKVVREYDPINWMGTGGPTDRPPTVPAQDFPSLSGLLLNEAIYDSNDSIKQKSTYTYQKEFSQFLLNEDKSRNLKTLLIASTLGTEIEACNYDQKFYLAYQYFMWRADCRLISKEVKKYEGNEVFDDITTYGYDTVHNLLTSTRFSNSKGDTFKISTQYVPDFANQHPYSDLMTLNRLAIPITNAKSTLPPLTDDPASQLSQKEFDFFDDKPLLKTISSGIQNTTPEVVTEIQRYDSRGNILQYKEKNGPTTVMLWGYHKQYPVAVIKGVAFDDISGLIDFPELENPPNNEDFHDYLLTLRNALQTYNADCHFYTYKPLVGISSEIDNTGKSVFYEYDSFNRLKYFLNERGEVLQALEHHYKQ